MSRAGILGLNERGIFILDHNSSDHKSFADSKIATKKFFANHNISVPKLYGHFTTMDQISDFSEIPTPFVIKPNKGFGGGGILVIDEQRDDLFYDLKGRPYTTQDLKRQCQDILAGYFSVTGGRDQVIVEQKIQLDDHIALLGTYGLPDIRVIVYNQIPLVAMLRIPSKYSDGKANLHQGAYAAGIDLGTGEISHLFARGRHVESLEGLGDIRGVIIPRWDEILELASQSQLLTRMPYIGCDIVLDQKSGPMLLEINARPGLQVQVVNKIGLAERLKKVADIHVDTAEKGVRLARDMFTRKASEKSEYALRERIGLREYVEVIFDNQKKHQVLAHIDPTKPRGSLSQSFFEQIIGSSDMEDQIKEITYKDDTPCVKLCIKLFGMEFHGLFEVIDGQEASVILGYSITSKFLIQPDKYGEKFLPPNPTSTPNRNAGIVQNQKNQTQQIDALLIGLDKKMPVLNFLRPLDIEQVRAQFILKKGKTPVTFRYDTERLPDLDTIEKKLEGVVIPEIPLKTIYEAKLEELWIKLRLLRALSNEQDGRVSKYSQDLYGDLEPNLIERAEKKLSKLGEGSDEEAQKFLQLDEIKETIQKFFHIYDLNLHIKFVPELISRVSVGRHELKVRNDILVNKSDLRAIIAHEIETHYFRRYNGSKHDLGILDKGTANYLVTEEGLAIYHQGRYLQSNSSKQTSFYKLYSLLDTIQHRNYREVIEYLDYLYAGNLEKMFQVFVRLKRGIREMDSDNVFFKDSVYLNGLEQIEKFVSTGGSLKDLYVGKIATDEIDLFREQGYVFGEGMKLPLFID